MAFSLPYPTSPHPAFWGPVTASSNFCEEDYVVTSYIAEFINTLTNVTYIIYATHGLRKLHAHGQLSFFRSLPFFGLMGVGICSALFHATLREWPQLSDDLSMVVPTSLVLCRVVTFQMDDGKAAMTNGAILSALVAIYSAHIYYNNPVVHGLIFMVMLWIVAFNTRQLLAARVKDPVVKRKLRRIMRYGGISFASGFALWIVDRRACGSLTAAKRAIGMPWGFVLELHGWWHILTGVGAYVFIVLVEYLTSERAGKDPGDIFGWPVGWHVRDQDTKSPLTRAGR